MAYVMRLLSLIHKGQALVSGCRPDAYLAKPPGGEGIECECPSCVEACEMVNEVLERRFRCSSSEMKLRNSQNKYDETGYRDHESAQTSWPKRKP